VATHGQTHTVIHSIVMIYVFAKSIADGKLQIDSQLGILSFRAGKARDKRGLSRLVDLALIPGVSYCTE
jgi:hypothetical protein